MVAFARSDDEILAVLAHEAGHVHHRHAMRLVLQQSVALRIIR
jgi:Zn-dependent protease with chaperone function